MREAALKILGSIVVFVVKKSGILNRVLGTEVFQRSGVL